jgi:hypothetical protein
MQMESSQTKDVTVVVRVLPILSHEEKEYNKQKGRLAIFTTGATVTLESDKSLGEQKQFTFDAVMTGKDTTRQVFACTGVNAVNEAVRGVSTVMFAYGPTSSGKSYTLLGRDRHNSYLQNQDGTGELNVKGGTSEPFEEGQGIAAMTYDMLRKALHERSEKEQTVKYVIVCSALQVYLGHAFDLLSPEPTRALQLRTHKVERTLTDVGGEVRNSPFTCNLLVLLM